MLGVLERSMVPSCAFLTPNTGLDDVEPRIVLRSTPIKLVPLLLVISQYSEGYPS